MSGKITGLEVRKLMIKNLAEACIKAKVGDHIIIHWEDRPSGRDEGELMVKGRDGWVNPGDDLDLPGLEADKLAEAYWCDTWVIM